MDQTSPQLSSTQIRRGLEEHRFFAEYQPLVSASDGMPVAVESLARFRSPRGEVFGPEIFIQSADESGLLPALTDRILELAITAACEWSQGGLDLDVSINVSAGDLLRQGLPELVSSLCSAAGICPGRVVLEVTESRFFETTQPREQLDRLTKAGIRLALDDYGTGYSSLKQLRTIPFSQLKIDRSFVTGAADDNEASAVLRSCIDLAHELGLVVVAEGVERAEEWQLLVDLGCDVLQGFHVSRPLPANEVVNWWTSWRPPRRLKTRTFRLPELVRRRRGRLWTGALAMLAAAALPWLMHSTGERPSHLGRSSIPADPVPADVAGRPTNVVAVLPFVNLSNDLQQDFLSEGIAQTIAEHLARQPGLSVTGRVGNFALERRSRGIDRAAIARMLGAGYVLDGSVYRSGRYLRVSAALFAAADEQATWSRTYERSIDDVFSIQEDIGQSVVQRLTLVGNETPEPVSLRRTDTGAFELYLLGRAQLDQRTEPALRSALNRLEQALATDPDFVPALVSSAEALVLLAETPTTHGTVPLEEVYPRARERLQRAIALEVDFAPAYAVLGLLEDLHGNRENAITLYRQALALDPNHADAHSWLALALEEQGDWSSALEHYRRTVELEPLWPIGVMNMSVILVRLGRIDEATALLGRASSHFPELAWLDVPRARIEEFHGHLAAALNTIDGMARDSPTGVPLGIRASLHLHLALPEMVPPTAEWNLRVAASWAAGHEGEAVELARIQLGELPNDDEARVELATWEGLAGNHDRVIELLDELAAGREAFFGCNPLFKGLVPRSFVAVLLGHAYRSQGRLEDAASLAERLGACRELLVSAGVGQRPLLLMEAHRSAIEEHAENVIDNLEAAWELGYRDAYLSSYPVYGFLAGNPRWLALLERHDRWMQEQRAQAGAGSPAIRRSVRPPRRAPTTARQSAE